MADYDDDTVWAPPSPPGASSPWPPPVGPPTWSAPAVPPTAAPHGAPATRRRRRAGGLAVVAAAAVLAAGAAIGVARTHDAGSASRGPVVVVPAAPAGGDQGGTSSPDSQAPTSVAPPDDGSQGATTVPGTDAPPATTAPPATSGGATTSQRAQLETGVVDIDTVLAYEHASAAGTGIILTANGEILTNNHVIDGATSIRVTVVTTGKTYTAKVVGTAPAEDLAVLQLQGASGLTPANLGDSTKVKVGDAVNAVGNAGGVGGAPSISPGVVTALGQEITATDQNGSNGERLTGLIQTNASLQPGDSGGPLFNAAGQVIGIDTAASAGSRFRRSATEGYAIPIAHALTIVKQIESGQGGNGITIGTTGFLGVEVDGSAASASNNGAVISNVLSGTPAAKIGLQAGDTVVAVDGKTVTTADSLGTMLRAHKPGDSVKITWVDASGAKHTASAVLVEGPAN